VKSENFLVDVMGYGGTAVLSAPLLIAVYRGQSSVGVALVVVVLLGSADLVPPLYHTWAGHVRAHHLRPPHATLSLIAIYTFLPIVLNRHAVAIAVVVSSLHLVVLSTVTYRDLSTWPQMVSILVKPPLICIWIVSELINKIIFPSY
jgi:hypothetical protein